MTPTDNAARWHLPYVDLPAPEEMATWDRAASADYGLREEILMENASREALHVLREELTASVTGIGTNTSASNGASTTRSTPRPASSPFSFTGLRVLLFMGGGNNGGDAAALARHLHDAGAEVLVLHTRPLGGYRGAAGYHVRLAKRCGVPFRPAGAWPRSLPDSRWLAPRVVVDGLLGTGFSGALREREAGLVTAINELADRAFVLALDIPSGLGGLTGRPRPDAVCAHATVTFEAAKPGLILPEAVPYTGRLHVRPIGIPHAVRTHHPASYRMLDDTCLAALPAPTPCMHKGTAGHVLVVGGSEGLTGAPLLAGLGALRGGAGLVTVACPGGLAAEVKAATPDVMTLPLGERRAWDPAALPGLLALAARCNALVIGPGMGRSPEAAEVLSALLALPGRPPAVIDADGLFPLAEGLVSLDLVRETDIVTPHPGEMARLAGLTTADVQRGRAATARAFAARCAGVLVLKGAGSLVTRHDRPITIIPLAAPTLAVAGSGDVLSGLAGALLAQGAPTEVAACLAAYLHAKAGQLLLHDYPARGNTPSEIADAIPRARKEHLPCC